MTMISDNVFPEENGSYVILKQSDDDYIVMYRGDKFKDVPELVGRTSSITEAHALIYERLKVSVKVERHPGDWFCKFVREISRTTEMKR